MRPHFARFDPPFEVDLQPAGTGFGTEVLGGKQQKQLFLHGKWARLRQEYWNF